MSNLLSSGRSGGGGGEDGRAPAPLCTSDQGSLGLSGVELTGASTPSSRSRMKHCDSAGRRQEAGGADVLGLAPCWCQRDSVSAEIPVVILAGPWQGGVVRGRHAPIASDGCFQMSDELDCSDSGEIHGSCPSP